MQNKEWGFCSELDDKNIYKFRRHESVENIELLFTDIIDSIINITYLEEENNLNKYFNEVQELELELKENLKSLDSESKKIYKEDILCLRDLIRDNKKILKDKRKVSDLIAKNIDNLFGKLLKTKKRCNFSYNCTSYLSHYYKIDRIFIEDFIAKLEDLVYNINIEDRENILKQIFEIKKDLINNVKYTNMIGE